MIRVVCGGGHQHWLFVDYRAEDDDAAAQLVTEPVGHLAQRFHIIGSTCSAKTARPFRRTRVAEQSFALLATELRARLFQLAFKLAVLLLQPLHRLHRLLGLDPQTGRNRVERGQAFG